MPLSTRHFLRRIAIAFVVAYVVLVATFSALKVWLGAEKPPWAEVFYGPAITVGSCYLLVGVAVWLECRMRQKV
jgi:hypothetical protein